MNTTSVRVAVWIFVACIGLASSAWAGTPNITFTTPPGWSDKLVLSNTSGAGSTVDTPTSTTDNVYLDFAITNNGTSDVVGAFQIKVLINGVQFGPVLSQNGLTVGQTATFEDILLGQLAVGSPTIAVQLDTGGAIGETNEADNFYSRNINVTAPTPVVTSTNPPTGTEGVAYLFKLQATNNPTSFTTSVLPSGLTLFNDATGYYIQGTPNVGAIGSNPVTISATNNNGTGSANVSITINARPPSITSPGSATAVIGRPFTYSITALGSPTIGFQALNLPAGLSLTGALISGTPTQGGNVKIKLIATNGAGTDSIDLNLTIQSPPVISSLLVKSANAGAAFNYTITASQSPSAFAASIIEVNGTALGSPVPLTGSGTAGTNGLQINSSTGVISANTGFFTNPGQYVLKIRAGGTVLARSTTGTVTTAMGSPTVNGTATAFQTELVIGDRIQVGNEIHTILSIASNTQLTVTTPFTNAFTNVALTSTLFGTGRLVLGVSDPAFPQSPAITSPLGTAAQPIVAVESDAFAYGITGTNNPTSFSAIVTSSPISLASNDLSVPGNGTGLLLNPSTGVISGVPVLAAANATAYQIELSATNAQGTSPQSPTSTFGAKLNLRIDRALARVTSAKEVNFRQPGNFQYQMTGIYTDPNQYGPVIYNAVNLPGFLSLDSSTGLISQAAPTSAGVYGVDLSITNNRGAGPTQRLYITISDAAGPFFTNAKSALGLAGQPFSFYMQVTTANVLFSDAAPDGINLTTGLAALGLNPINGATGQITGTINAGTPNGVYTVEIDVVDTNFLVATFLLKIQVVNSLPFNGPTFNNSLVANSTAGLPFNFDVTIAGSAAGEPVPNVPDYIGAFPLPVGVALQNTTFIVPSDIAPISGLPTQPGTTFTTLTAVNPSGSDVTSLVVTINNIAITSATVVNGQVGVPLSPYQVTATGLPIRYDASGLPAGLSIDQATGLITGIPAEAISVATDFPVVVSASNPFATGTATVTFHILPSAPGAPTITNSLNATAFDGMPFTFQITTNMDGPPTAITSYSAVGLPAGFVLDNDPNSPTNTFGQISGTSSQLGLYSVIITASVGNATDAKVLNLRVSPIPPSNIVPADGTVILGVEGQPLSVPLTASGSTPLFFAITSGALPGNLVLNVSTIQGTPVPGSAGDYPVVLNTSNAGGSVNTSLTFRIRKSPVIADPGTLTGFVGAPFSYTPTVTGSAPLSIVFSGGIPLGLGVVGNTLTGTPAVGSTGSYNVTVTASNGALPDAVRIVNIVINTMQITSPLTATGAVGQPFSYTLQATGSPTTFSFGSAANFPPGVTLTAPDTISGTPTQAGGFVLPLTVSNAGGASATANLQIGISSVPGAPAIISNLLQTGVVGQNFSYAINATNNPTSYSASITAGPAGPTYPIPLTPVGDPVTGFSLSGSTISGVMTTPGTFTINITATNGVGSGSANLQAAISSVTGGPAITSRLTDNANSGVPYSYQITATNAPVGLNNFAVTTPLPNGLSLNADTGLISGTPVVLATTTFNIGLKVTTNIGSATATLVLNIASGAPTYTAPLTVNAPAGQPLTYIATATGQGPITFTFSGNIPPGLSVTGPDTLSGTPTTEGSYNVNVNVSNPVTNINVTVLFVIGPVKPTLTIGTVKIGKVGLTFNLPLTALGSPPITFTVTGTLPTGLSFNGSAITGIPKESGTFSPIVITATNALGSDTISNFTILIQPRDEDSDGDGFPDEFEQSFGSDPLDAKSTPFGGGKPAGELQVLNIKSASIKLTFPPAGRDTIKVTGSFNVPDGFAAANKDATFFVGGVIQSYTLDKRGGKKVGGNSLKITSKGTLAKFTASFSKGTFSDDLEDDGLDGAKGQIAVSRQVRIILMVNNTLYQSKKLLSYTNKTGKTGSAKQVD